MYVANTEVPLLSGPPKKQSRWMVAARFVQNLLTAIVRIWQIHRFACDMELAT
ncbi:hypothetical protein GCM10027033_25010 [Leucobacter ruminantium]